MAKEFQSRRGCILNTGWARELIAVLFGLAFVLTSKALAIAPRFVSDDELAKYPIIVVAKWDKAPVKSNNKYRDRTGKVVTAIEAYTRIVILAVVKGKTELGEHDLMINWGISWANDGTFVNSGTSTMIMGDVDDITKPCLWFLQRKHSWDDKRKSEYLAVGNYREIQPLELKEFFVALGDGDAQMEVPKLLAADKPLVASRVLPYICGGRWPWQFDEEDWIDDKPEERRPLLRREAGRVWEFLQSDAKGQRELAASVYAELTGKAGITKIRTLLDDDDADVRGIAVGVLVSHRDEESLDSFAKAAQGLNDGAIACRVIKELAAWKDERTVPLLIGFLQSDDFGIPALKSQEALKAITGHDFPFDVATSQKAWEEAQRIDDKAERKRLLDKLAPVGHLVAAAVGLPSKEPTGDPTRKQQALEEDEFVVAIRLRNDSPLPVTVLKYPSQVTYSWPAGLCTRHRAPWGDDEPSGEDEPPGEKGLEFITLAPADDVRLEVIVSQGFLIAEPSERQLTLSYLANGSRQGVKAWIGTIDVEFCTDWEYQREIKQVEELWANGNLKSTGRTVNGVRYGEWNYFDEEGDRIKITYYGMGRGTATCNPKHPNNKGAGKRQAK